MVRREKRRSEKKRFIAAQRVREERIHRLVMWPVLIRR
jgi:hypothetical protein